MDPYDQMDIEEVGPRVTVREVGLEGKPLFRRLTTRAGSTRPCRLHPHQRRPRLRQLPTACHSRRDTYYGHRPRRSRSQHLCPC